MYSKGPDKNDDPDCRPVRTSDRLRRRPNVYGRPFIYYSPSIIRPKRNKTKTRTAASQIAKMLRPGNRPIRSSNTNNSAATSVRRSTRKRRISTNLDDYTDSSGSEDNDIMKPRYRSSRRQMNSRASRDVFSDSKRQKASSTRSLPRREGLRPRRSQIGSRKELMVEFDEEEDSSEDKASLNETENGNDVEDNDAEEGDGQDEGNEEDEGEGEDREEGLEGDDGEDGEEDGDDEDGEEEQEGRRRYDLRTRSDAHRLSREEGKQRPRSPQRVLPQGMGPKVGRDIKRGGSRGHKRHRMTRAEDSDDSLLVDELDQGPSVPWGRGGNRSSAPWLIGGLDIPGTTAWGLNAAAASGWGHQSDALVNSTAGVQSAGPSSKGGADIQPLQVDESVSFDEIGGLSGYIDSLKEMVFFPLLYPDFFASYNITPPRGVLLCGPPGTGKTLIARALASAASKAGQKVSFYMRKGADVLSKWVGEAERQLKLLFEEAQKNQPSIIFFDEIDGLAPVRSSKQEQIHNSIVSTLLALMDGLDSRGQVVLIGATNRVDAIDGALRRPGRFDREFNFSLPGCEARAEILNIHTRKWKQPPSTELKSELAASCVGYCGADIKALCTEAAIRAFREKYPQVYTSDDKFVIDVDSVKVEKYHFLEAMSTITPAAHRGSIVHSRPLSPVVAPCLQRHFKKAMEIISDIFPALDASYQSAKLSTISYGSVVPLMYRPRLLLYGSQGVGLDHLGPAILHELEKFPVHSLGLPSLLSDPSAKTPEEALVHIFSEARRTTPSILFCPQFNLWWDNAHEQLKAVLQTLLDDLPSDFPILLLGLSSNPPSELDPGEMSVFSHRNIYQVDKPSAEDRSLFFDRLTEAALSIQSETEKSNNSSSIPDLPKAPKVDNAPKASEIKAKAEGEQHGLRRLRMCLRDVCNRILYDKRFSAFHYPVLDEDAPDYRTIIQNPMDIATLLQRVDSGKYITCKMFLADFDLILVNAKKYNGDDYNGARIVSRACELRDSVHGMLSQMDPALVAFCDKIAAEGGPMPVPDELADSSFPSTPIVQLATNTRASARLRNAQPEVNLDQSYEALKRSKKNVDTVHAAVPTEEAPKSQDTSHLKPTQEPEVEDPEPQRSESSLPGTNVIVDTDVIANSEPTSETRPVDVVMLESDITDKIESVKRLFVERTDNYGVPQLELLYTRLTKGIFKKKATELGDDLNSSILRYLVEFAENEANF